MSKTPATDCQPEYLSFRLDDNGQCIPLVKKDFARQLERENAELRSALKDLLEQVESLDGYQVTRDLDRYKAEACFDDAMERARNALSRS
jgi:hypothetical protein